MKTQKAKIYDHLLNIRVPFHLAEHAQQIANEQAISLSAFTRQAIQRNIRIYTEHEREILKRASA